MDSGPYERGSKTGIRNALMAKEIINRVANSKLSTIDLEDIYPDGPRTTFDIAPWLLEGIVLREKDFRLFVKEHDWSQYDNHFVALHCTTDAIIPGWAYMLVSLQLAAHAQQVVVGTLSDLETVICTDLISKMDLEPYRDTPVIIKGCAQKPIPENAFVLLAQRLQPIAKNIMYGEACSSVPLYKRR